jgi:DNA gyrase subunit A
MAETGKTIPVSVEDEVKTDYLNYAMSVIVARALPDVRDGLKPVHRRLLYAMDELASYNRAHQGKRPNHGDAWEYTTPTAMPPSTTPGPHGPGISLRYTLVLGLGNFGSIDGPPAASRIPRPSSPAWARNAGRLDKERWTSVPTTTSR